jgi:hypothetical protein
MANATLREQDELYPDCDNKMLVLKNEYCMTISIF